jgi:hypothetical protein
MAILYDYEVSTNGAERKWIVPFARLEDNTPEAGNPALLISRLLGTQVGGAILTVDADAAVAVIDFTPGKIYGWQVRNVLTYAGAAESTFVALNIGDPVYYDSSPTMPAGVQLSASPLDSAGAANPLFGFVMAKDDPDMALYPKGAATASTQAVGVMVRGAGA